ncbi:uncharacterized protein JN550_006908 [Neoarthrinium moseri]|uniref:uncharacterized protein n=1 Tax=Neoarthrinium moseri TaxID=1658444 RepID=UPI001FDC422B|nr:uncharacterized protein JN550_006908 [Neoarthrinium moseri]KAI1867767.1 hypothetical protein JN550_006908 [Neoarthrinium moseri]
MDMGDMEGMMELGMTGMSSGGMFQPDNMALARAYWYLIAGVLALLFMVRMLNHSQNWARLRSSRTSSVQFPTKPTNGLWQIWATLTAVGREISYPQLYVPSTWFSWMTPPPMGRVICLFIYWAVIIYMMTAGAIIKDAYFWERIGFRNAWVTVTQLRATELATPMGCTDYVCHSNNTWVPLLDRMGSRRLSRVGIADDGDVKWGLGGWAILLWMVVTSFKPLRSVAYEVFVAQHIIAAVIFLWVVYVHVPEDARYNIWFAIAALCFDRVFRLGLLLWQNLKFNPNPSKCKGGQKFGHQTQVSAVGDSITILTIKDVHFKWRAGQHLYLWLPRVGLLEAHPYTIACPHQMPATCICNSIQLVVRSHSGFSKRLHSFAKKLESSEQKRTITAFVAGPYGRPPRWDIFETLVLISASTGASFTLPILESVLQSKGPICTKRIDFLLAARQGEEIGFYLDRLHDALSKAHERGIDLSVSIAVTGNGQLETISGSLSSRSGSRGSQEKKDRITERTEPSEKVASGGCCSANVEAGDPSLSLPRKRLSNTSIDSHIHHSSSRPNVADFVRTAVEATGGETGVVVCGGVSLVAKVRTSVAKLSDERAVHKGTGAQGIHLHVEEYCF